MILVACLSIYSILILGSMATMSIGIGVIVLGYLAAMGGPIPWFRAMREELQRPQVRTYFYWTVALTLACLVSLLGAKFFPLEYGGKGPEVHLAKDMAKAWYFFWPLFLLPGLRRLHLAERRTILKVWLIAFTLLSILGIFQFFNGWPRPQPIPERPNFFHATLFLGHHLSVASIFIFPFFAVLDAWRNRVFSRKWLTLAALVGALCLLATVSRALWLALPASLFVYVIFALPRKWAAALVTLAGASAFGLYQIENVRSRIRSGEGIHERYALWNANWEFFKARPITGAGWHHNLELSGYYLEIFGKKGVPIFSGHAHNNLIEVAASLGIIGVISWIGWNLFVVWIAWKNWRNQKTWFALGLVCAWIAFQVNGLTQVNFWESKVIHSMMWVVAWSLLWMTEKPALDGASRKEPIA